MLGGDPSANVLGEVHLRIATDGCAPNQRGIALVAALLALVVAFALAGTFMITTVGERSLTSNVHIARNALFAADAGVRMSQQSLANMAQAKLDSLINFWPGNGPVIPNPQGLFPAGNVVITCASPRFTSTAQITFADSVIADTAQVYNYNYSIVASGGFGGFGARRVQSQGVLRVSASHGTFADFLMFTDIQTFSDGGTIWFSSSGTFDGRVHSNGKFRFAYAPSFYDHVTSANLKATYYNRGSPKDLASDHNGTIDVPNFYGGFQLNAPHVDLPANSNIQKNAALGLPTTAGVPTNAAINAQIGVGGSGTPPNGIYVVNSGGAVTGGIYVQGTLDQCALSVDSLGRQIYDMVQGATHRVITVDSTSSVTTVTDGVTTTTFAGAPSGALFVNGTVSDLRGPERNGALVPPPAIASQTQLLITATGDILIKRDVTCEEFDTGNNVLGIYSIGGNVRIHTSAPDDLYLDAFVMAIGSQGVFKVDNYSSGSPRGTFHLRGGMVSRYYGAFYTFNSSGEILSGYARDFHYDRRGVVPPFYPSINLFVADQPLARTLVWKEL